MKLKFPLLLIIAILVSGIIYAQSSNKNIKLLERNQYPCYGFSMPNIYDLGYGQCRTYLYNYGGIMYPCYAGKVKEAKIADYYSKKEIKRNVIELNAISTTAFLKTNVGQHVELLYYQGNEDELYERIKRNEIIEDAFIDTLYFDRLVSDSVMNDKNNQRKIIKCAVRLDNCIINHIEEPYGFGPGTHLDEEDSLQGNFKYKHTHAPSSFKKTRSDSLIFLNDFILVNSVLDYFTLNNASFHHLTGMWSCLPIYKVSENSGNNFNFKNCVFYDTTVITAYNFRNDGKQLVSNYFKQTEKYNQLIRTNSNSVSINMDQLLVQYMDDSLEFVEKIMPYAYGEYSTNILTTYNFQGCQFQGKNNSASYLSIENTEQTNSIDFVDCRINMPVYFSSENTGAEKFPSVKNLNFRNTDFLKQVNFLAGYRYVDCTFEVFYNDSVFIGDADFFANGRKELERDTTFFENSFFKANTVVYLSELNLTKEKFPRISLLSLKNIEFTNDMLYEQHNELGSYLDLTNYQKFIQKIQEIISANYKDQGDMKTKLDHDYLKMEKNFYWNHFWDDDKKIGKFSKAAGIARYNFLELMVGNGYRGESNFFFATLLVVFVFSFLYSHWHRTEVVNYVLVHYENDQPKDEVKYTFINYCRCLWLSCIILINPKFPATFFKERSKLFLIFTIQWTIGLIMIILFLVYIASQYPILTKMTGI